MKVQVLDSMLKENFHKNFPVKITKVSTDDSPLCNNKVKLLKRLKCHEFNKQRNSEKWNKLHDKYTNVQKGFFFLNSLMT